MYAIKTKRGFNVMGTETYKTQKEAIMAKAKLIRETKTLAGAAIFLQFPIRKITVKKRKK
jgi:hypothetical protein